MSIWTYSVRSAAGVGGLGDITERSSIGALVDFGYMAGPGVDAFLTMGVHFGMDRSRPRPRSHARAAGRVGARDADVGEARRVVACPRSAAAGNRAVLTSAHRHRSPTP
ncbi:MAG: hypothetical protein KC486_26855 [Myxococcales bacterium]|nr:hypothetical protein [Myxococcales bacterium]